MVPILLMYREPAFVQSECRASPRYPLAAAPTPRYQQTMYRTPADIDPGFARFLDLFEQGRFWDSHEALEGPWRHNGSDFFHALILLASAFVHVRRGNRHGIAAQLAKADPILQRHAPHYLGIDVDNLLAHAAACRQIVAENPDAPPEAWAILIPFPTMTFDPGRVRGDEAELNR
jgi:predicted metal-dependent hydrolase